jgi:transcription termination factor Rho
MAADLAVERARRQVELGLDVVVMVDSLTDLAGAHARVGGGARRSTGADTDEPRRLLTQARNIEVGGSLTVIAAVDPAGDSVRGASRLHRALADACDAEIWLDPSLAAAHRLFTIDVRSSRTTGEERFLSADELQLVRAVQRVLRRLKPSDAADTLTTSLGRNGSNAQLLLQIRKQNPGLLSP